MTENKELTYIVCSMYAPNMYDTYSVYIDNYEDAKKEYQRILNRDDTHSVSLCVVLESSDYPGYELK